MSAIPGFMKGLGYTFKQMFAEKSTYDYPNEPLKMPERFRGIQYLDVDKCIVCLQCQRICPTQCIDIKGKPNPEGKGKVLESFDINFEICILCDLCTEVCPTEAILMTNNYELATYSRDELFKDMKWLNENDENIRRGDA